MSEESPITKISSPTKEEHGEGPNLAVAYSLLVVALLLAMGIAVLIVLPFYRHRH